jgi:hypothetical protein
MCIHILDPVFDRSNPTVIAPLRNNRLNMKKSFLRWPEAAAMFLGLCIPHNKHEQCKHFNHLSLNGQ